MCGVKLCQNCKMARYQALAGGSEPLQSYLHKRLAENLNSEMALGTVGDIAQCVEWLRSTFLHVRAAKDPKRYLGLTAAAPEHLILKKIEELCVIAINGLSSAGLISMDEASCIASTDAGRLMSLYYLDVETMKHIMKIQGNESLERLLWIICESHELADMHLRRDERRVLNALNRNNTAATIRFPIKGKITTRQMKLCCIIQAILGCLPITDPSLNQEATKVMRIADRICKCLVAYVTNPERVSQQLQRYTSILNSIILAKCVATHLWENSPYVSKQLKGIGPAFSTLLASAGKNNFMVLEESHPRDLERIMNKGPPAGNILRKQISLLPKYQLNATPVDEKTVSVTLVLLNQAFLSENMEQLTAGTTHKCYVIAGDSENHILMMRTFTDNDLISVYDGSITYEITRKHNIEHKIFVHCISSSFAGVDVQCEYTFTNLMPSRLKYGSTDSSTYYWSESATINNKESSKHANTSNTAKDRKRKKYTEEIAKSKEKIKRESALSKKIKLLKESFGRTSNSLKKDLQSAQEVSNNMLNDLELSNISKSSDVMCTEVDNKKESNSDINPKLIDFESEISLQSENLNDFMDDATINSILDNIENEITRTTKSAKSPQNAFNLKGVQTDHGNITNSKVQAYNPFGATAVENRPSIIENRINKRPKSKSNYQFLDFFEKNMDFSDDEVIPQKESGFSETIKSQIEKYILKSHKTPNTLESTLKELCEKPHETIDVFKDCSDGIHKDILKSEFSSDNITDDTRSNLRENFEDVIMDENNLINKKSDNNHSDFCSDGKTNNMTQLQPTSDMIICYRHKNNNKEFSVKKWDINHFSQDYNENAETNPSQIEKYNLEPHKEPNTIESTMKEFCDTIDVINGNLDKEHKDTLKPELTSCENVMNNSDLCSYIKVTTQLQPNSDMDIRYDHKNDEKKTFARTWENNIFCNDHHVNPVNRARSKEIKKSIEKKNSNNSTQNENDYERLKLELAMKCNELENSLKPIGNINNNYVDHASELHKNIDKKMMELYLPLHNPNKTSELPVYNQNKSSISENAIMKSTSVAMVNESFNMAIKSLIPVPVTNNFTSPSATLEIPLQTINKMSTIHTHLNQCGSYTNKNPLYTTNNPLYTTNNPDNNNHISTNNSLNGDIPKMQFDAIPIYENVHEQNKGKTPINASYEQNTKNSELKKNTKKTDNDNELYDETYSFSTEKVDVQTKFTDDHKIRVIRRLKVDLDIRKIVSSFDRDSNLNNEQKQTGATTRLTPKNKNINTKENLQNTLEISKLTTTLYETGENVNSQINIKDTKLGDTSPTYNNKLKGEEKNECCCNYTGEIQSVIPHTENNVVNILQKYGKIIKNKKKCEYQVSSNLTLKSRANSIKPNTYKPNRPFKISDIQHFNVPLTSICEGLIISNANTEIPTKREVIESSKSPVIQTYRQCINTSSIPKDSSEILKRHPNEYMQLTPCQSPLPPLEHALDISEDDFTIDQSLFNPQTLLQSLRNESDEIIPPPPEFDNYSYSPETTMDLKLNNDLSNQLNFSESTQSPTFDGNVLKRSLFEDDSRYDVNLHPTKEVETWILNREDEYQNSLPQAPTMQSYTVVRKKENYQNDCHVSSNNVRQGASKLHAFKFNRKNKLKLEH